MRTAGWMRLMDRLAILSFARVLLNLQALVLRGYQRGYLTVL